MTTNRSREALSEFLDYIENKGLSPAPTVQGRKAATNRVLSILSPEEAADVTVLDLDDVMSRFMNLNPGAYTPESLRAYRGRTGNAIRDFKAYLENPMGFRPIRSSVKLKQKSDKAPNNGPVSSKSQTRLPEAATPAPAQMPRVNIIPIPIRADLVVHIEGVPFNLTGAEARRIANVILALANEQT